MSTQRFESIWRKNVSFICSKEPKKQVLLRIRTYQSLGITVVLRHWCIGPETATTTSKVDPPFSIRATHLLGFPNTKNNCKGTLSVKNDALRFEQDAKPAAEVKIASVQGVFLGSESKQVGGTPAMIGEGCGSVRKWPSRQSLYP